MRQKPDTPSYVQSLARQMRIEQTPAEELLWRQLRREKLDGCKFYRQYPIGRYIADFCCTSRGLVIELDGKIHNTGRSMEYDRIRDHFFLTGSMKIVRFRNEQVIADMETVLMEIRYMLTL